MKKLTLAQYISRDYRWNGETFAEHVRDNHDRNLQRRTINAWKRGELNPGAGYKEIINKIARKDGVKVVF